MSSGSWMDEVLANDEDFPVARPGRATGVRDVVTTFLRNDAGFSAENVRSYVNAALQNEAGERVSEYELVANQAESMRLYADSLRQRQGQELNFEPPRDPDEIDADVASQLEAAHLERQEGLVGLGELVTELRESQVVDLDVNTWQMLESADKLSGGAVSEGLREQVQAARSEHVEQVWSGRAPALPAPAVDFSRDGLARARQRDELASAREAQRQQQAEADARRAAPRREPTRREQGERLLRTRGMTTAGDAVAAWMASHGRAPDGSVLEETTEEVAKDAGPSLG